jgi:alpha-L-rhamnosidase
VRVAPRLGRLSFARGSAPSPHGIITVEASRTHLTIDSPVPVALDLADEPDRTLPAGRHELTSETLTDLDTRRPVAPAR